MDMRHARRTGSAPRPTLLPQLDHAAPRPDVPVPASLMRAHGVAPQLTVYELALRLTKILVQAHPTSRFGIAVSRRRSLADLFRTPVPKDARMVLHLVVEDDPSLLFLNDEGGLSHIAYEFKRDASPTGWDALEYIYSPSSPELRDALRAIQYLADITLTSLHTNAFGERTIVWDFESTCGPPPDMALAQVLMYDSQHQLLVRA